MVEQRSRQERPLPGRHRELAAGGGELTRDPQDDVDADAGLGRHRLEREVLVEKRAKVVSGVASWIASAVEPATVLVDELAVVKALGHQHLRHPQGENSLGARPHRDPFVGRRSGDR